MADRAQDRGAPAARVADPAGRGAGPEDRAADPEDREAGLADTEAGPVVDLAPDADSLTRPPWPQAEGTDMSRYATLLLLVLMLGGCTTGSISRKELAGEPEVYATVHQPPDRLLVGCYMRPNPSEFKRPNSYSYCLVRKGDRFAVYYSWRDGKTRVEHRGWMPFTIEGDRLVSDTDPSLFRVKDGKVWHGYAGRDKLHPMIRF